MPLKQQISRLKENWLLVVLVLLAVFFVSGSPSLLNAPFQKNLEFATLGMSDQFSRGIVPDAGFAPEVEIRKIITSASLTAEVKRGKFRESEKAIREIVSNTGGLILNENVDTSGSGVDSRLYGNYNLRIPSEDYDSVVQQLKALGEVKSFSENSQDITGSYTNARIEFESEQTRLERFKKLMESSAEMADTIQLTDRIFDMERRIKYLEEALSTDDERIEYASISVSLQEKASGFAGIMLVKFSEIVRGLVNSFNSLVILIVIALPYALALVILRIIYVWYKKKARF